MAIAKVTFKGQITIPKKVREALDIQEGDSVLFLVEDGQATMVRLPQADLLEFYGTFAATKLFPGKEAIRQGVRRKVARQTLRETG